MWRGEPPSPGDLPKTRDPISWGCGNLRSTKLHAQGDYDDYAKEIEDSQVLGFFFAVAFAMFLRASHGRERNFLLILKYYYYYYYDY